MFRIPILITLAGITGFFLYQNENKRIPLVQKTPTTPTTTTTLTTPTPTTPTLTTPTITTPTQQTLDIDSDDDFSDTASISDLDL